MKDNMNNRKSWTKQSLAQPKLNDYKLQVSNIVQFKSGMNKFAWATKVNQAHTKVVRDNKSF